LFFIDKVLSTDADTNLLKTFAPGVYGTHSVDIKVCCATINTVKQDCEDKDKVTVYEIKVTIAEPAVATAPEAEKTITQIVADKTGGATEAVANTVSENRSKNKVEEASEEGGEWSWNPPEFITGKPPRVKKFNAKNNGKLEITFDKPMRLNGALIKEIQQSSDEARQLAKVDNKFISIEYAPDQLEPGSLTWNITDYDNFTISIDLKFRKPAEVSAD